MPGKVTDQPGADAITLQNNQAIRDAYAAATGGGGGGGVGSVTGAMILDGTIEDIDVSPVAAIQTSKIQSVAWTTYTPVITCSTTNPTGWVLTGRYQRIDRMVLCSIEATYGTTAGAGFYRFSLPVAAANLHKVVGQGLAHDASPAQYHDGVARLVTATTVELIVLDINFNLTSFAYQPISATVPFSLGAGDFVELNLSYEAVS